MALDHRLVGEWHPDPLSSATVERFGRTRIIFDLLGELRIVFENGPWKWGQATFSSRLLLEPTRGVTIALVSSRERKRRQPGLAADDPELVGRPQLVRRIEGA